MVPICVSDPIGEREPFANRADARDRRRTDCAEADEQNAELALARERFEVVPSQAATISWGNSMFFLRKSTLERLPVVMSGVRMGERALQIGVDDSDARRRNRCESWTERTCSGCCHGGTARGQRCGQQQRGQGRLSDVQVAPLDSLPFADNAFDVVMVHAAGVKPGHGGNSGRGAFCATHSVSLRGGGRLVIIEGSGSGLMTRLRASNV